MLIDRWFKTFPRIEVSSLGPVRNDFPTSVKRAWVPLGFLVPRMLEEMSLKSTTVPVKNLMVKLEFQNN